MLLPYIRSRRRLFRDLDVDEVDRIFRARAQRTEVAGGKAQHMLSRGHAGHYDETVVFDQRVFCGQGLDASKLVDEAEAKRVYLPIAVVTEDQRHLLVAESGRLDGLPV